MLVGEIMGQGQGGGRPLKYRTVEEMQIIIDEYFERQDREQRPYTVTGLAHALKIDREQLLEYVNRDMFSDSLKDARMRIQIYAEESLWACRNPAGPIFNLKNNYGWRDTQDVNVNVSGGFAERLTAAAERRQLQQATIDVIAQAVDQDDLGED